VFFSGAALRATMSQPRLLVLAGPSSVVRVVESYATDGRFGCFTNAVTEIAAADGAVVDHYKVQRESPSAFHVSTMQARLDRSVTFSSHAITLGGGLVRNDIVAVLDGEGGDCTLNGLYLADGDRLVDNHTTIDHAKPQIDEDALFYLQTRGIGRSRARNLLIHAFASDVLARVQVPELRERLEAALMEQLPSAD
jgi:Fe-S cluster assembly protein SufD